MIGKVLVFSCVFLALSTTADAGWSLADCTDRFNEILLPHTTTTRGAVVRFYESNGSGVGINDLNGDGLLDIVLGNLKDANTILWNQGAMQFRAEAFGRSGRTRAVALVDVDADGWQDIVLTTQLGSPSWWRNNGDETFTFETLPGVTIPAQTMGWGDADGDGDLDLATASYDSELLQLMRDTFLFGDGAGVVYYENRDGVFTPTRLADEAQALAMWLADIDGDDRVDLMVGNDFSFPDQSWTLVDGGWQSTALFDVMTYSTMSYDMGDLDNDGTAEFFAADMRPTVNDADTEHAWRYVFESLNRASLLPGDTQISENILLQQQTSAVVNEAEASGVAATGWSWSSKFGDLDSDGFLDLYTVTGMASQELFTHLPGNELVEPNLAFRGEAGLGFTPVPEWGLNSLSGGRGMSMGDLDDDGDLDIVVNNLNSPSALYENDLCGGDSLQVELRWQESRNPFGIGARLVLTTSTGAIYRDMRAISGYLSGDPARVHFGFPAESKPLRLDVYWTDGVVSSIESFGSDPILTVSR